jgi:hypothetical protein
VGTYIRQRSGQAPVLKNEHRAQAVLKLGAQIFYSLFYFFGFEMDEFKNFGFCVENHINDNCK